VNVFFLSVMAIALIAIGGFYTCSTLRNYDGGANGPRFGGIVRSHVDSYRSGIGVSSDLIRSSRMSGGFEFNDQKKKDWKSVVTWAFVDRDKKSDVYEFHWRFSLVNGALVEDQSTVLYNGEKSVIIFENEYEVISIEPGSIPLD